MSAFLCRLLYTTRIFFSTFYLLKVSFWMAINLRFWNPQSERIWWVKQVIFYHIVVYDRFEGLHFLSGFFCTTSIFLRNFYLPKVSFWMAIILRFWNPQNVYDGLNTSFFTTFSFTTVSKVYTSSVDSCTQSVFFLRPFTFKRFHFEWQLN